MRGRTTTFFLATALALSLGSLDSCCFMKQCDVEPSRPPAAAVQPVPRSDDIEVFAVAQTNDIHGYIFPQRAYLRIDPDKPEGYVATLGGFDWFAGYLDILRKSVDGRLVLVDAGDMFQGTMISNRFEGATVVKVMNYLGYHVTALGNHEFDFGRIDGSPEDSDPFGAIKARLAELKFPVLAANLYDARSGKRVDWKGLVPWALVEVAGVKVGFVGGITLETPFISRPEVQEHFRFGSLVEEINRYAPELRRRGAGIVIGVVHAGGKCKKLDDPYDLSSCVSDEELFELANALQPGTVDLLVGGHTHQPIAHFVNGIPVLETSGKGTTFGLAWLHYSKRLNKVVKVELQRPVGICHYHFEEHGECVYLSAIPQGSTVPATFLGQRVKPLPFVESLLDEKEKLVLKEAQEKLGPEAMENLVKMDPGRDHPLGLLLGYVLLEEFPEASFVLLNESGLRSEIPAGSITMEDVFEVFPFDSTPALLRLNGQQFLDLLRVASSGAHSLPVVRGVRVVIDRMRDECIAEDWNRDGLKEDWERNLLVSAKLIDGTDIPREKEFVIVTSSYLAQGGSDFSRVLKPLGPEVVESRGDGRTLRELVVDWMRQNPGRKLGGRDDPVTSAGPVPFLTVLHYDHEPGTTCLQLNRKER